MCGERLQLLCAARFTVRSISRICEKETCDLSLYVSLKDNLTFSSIETDTHRSSRRRRSRPPVRARVEVVAASCRLAEPFSMVTVTRHRQLDYRHARLGTHILLHGTAPSSMMASHREA